MRTHASAHDHDQHYQLGLYRCRPPLHPEAEARRLHTGAVTKPAPPCPPPILCLPCLWIHVEVSHDANLPAGQQLRQPLHLAGLRGQVARLRLGERPLQEKPRIA